MPRKYSDQTKREAIGIGQNHADISFTRYATAVQQRALGVVNSDCMITSLSNQKNAVPSVFSLSAGGVYATYATCAPLGAKK